MYEFKVSKEPLNGGMFERLDAIAKSGLYEKWDKITAETIQAWHYNLSDSELDICKWVFWTMWDIGHASCAMYDEVVLRLIADKLFANEKEIEDTMKILVSKSVLEIKQETWMISGEEEPMKTIRFPQKNMHEELMRASCDHFERVTDEFFKPQRKIDDSRRTV